MTAAQPAPLSGACLCGAVTLSARAGASELHACHCSMCRKWTGSAFVEFDVHAEDLVVAGPVRRFASSNWAERAFCDRCGSTLWYRLTTSGHESYAVAAGLFDNAGGFPLTREIFIDRKPEGYAFAGDHPRQTEQEFLAAIAAANQGETP
ncbi:GFA family protein [Tropicimonas sp. IMCC34043]|uniref:GFA family protein n=1 Tax=Tropicimonas sp. IMCC34043 TaxID=2248760 RepID=UPI001E48D6AB|nr:GFA family protein [Tropicimonas sp. IMCC34043]